MLGCATKGCLAFALACNAQSPKGGRNFDLEASDRSQSTQGGALSSSRDEAQKKPKLDDAAWSKQYEGAKAQIDTVIDSPADSPARAAVVSQLAEVAKEAKDAHLRANASLALGLLYERVSDLRTAISYYRQARAWVPQEPEVYAVLALALAQDGELVEAIAMQEELCRLVPDDLQAWLFLGELNIKAKREEDAKLAYAAYEARRKGLLDGLTKKSQGQYEKPEADRIACAHALAPSRDSGTALGLLYALSSEPSSRVREAIAATIAEHRLRGYVDGLNAALAKESDPDTREALKFALAEIARAPLDAAAIEVPAPADSTQ
jgi:tetratricopeptide (TPR) repeat protein